MKIRLNTAILLATVLLLTAMPMAARAGDSCPIAENQEISTYRNVSVGGQLRATDPDGDTVTFELTTEPVKGTLDLEEDGSFVYTPKENKRGKDYFGFKAVDCDGNCSSEATVIIKIEKQRKDVFYEDIADTGCAAAATALAERGVFVGECVGGNYVFRPDAAVTRGEFMAMCVKLTGCDMLTGVMSTGFADDDAIPEYLKPCVSTALLSGIITGQAGENSAAVADVGSAISYSEAAVMLNRALELTDVSYAKVSSAIPAWAVQACANLSACDISLYEGSSALSRAQCAEMLSEALRLVDAR